jgi:hypothetical protein
VDGIVGNEIDQSPLFRLPHWVRLRIAELGISSPEIWIQQKIPALNDQSVLETLKHYDDDTLLREYFAKVRGKF